MHYPKIFLFLVFACLAKAQIQQFPYNENFDTVIVPALPPGWLTTTNRSSSGDFTTTKSTPYSDSNAVISTNAAIEQSLLSPLLDFSNKEADSLKFYERRSGSHNSGMLLEASTDGGSSFPIQISDTVKNAGITSYILRTFKLPPTLSNQPFAKLRWRLLGNGTGTTGTIRLDNVTITARVQFDAAVTALNILPQYPNARDSIQIKATIKNEGTQPIQNILVDFYDDLNNDSLPEASERFASNTISQVLLPGDTSVAQGKLVNLSGGQKTIIVTASFAADQNTANDTLRSTFSVGLAHNSIVINEIMYAPPPGEPEWLELFNTTSEDIDLKNWKLSNRNSSNKYTTSPLHFFINPQSYCIITKDSALFQNIHPNFSSAIIQVSSLPTFLFNNSGDAVALFDSRLAVMDSVRYYPMWGGTNGKSLERIEFDKPSNDSINWGSSGDSAGSTPGRQNYLTPLEFDLSASLVIPPRTILESPITANVIVRNVGHRPAENFSASLFLDANADSLAESSELLQQQFSNSSLAPKDSALFHFTINHPRSGKQLLIAGIDYAEDLRLSNNTAYGTVKISFEQNSLVINEIMYDPKAGSTEYVELFNRSTEIIDVRDWRLSDKRDTSGKANEFVISKSSLTVRGGEFLVVTSDSSLLKNFSYLSDPSIHVVVMNKSSLGLNNDGDDVVLRDLTGTLIDSVRYSPTWHNAELTDVSGRSLERINPNLSSNDKRNWSTSANPLGGTPGKQNSLYTISVPSEAALSFSPNPFSPDGDGFEDVTILSYQLPATTGLIRVRIYDIQGRLIRTLANSEPSGSRGEIIWDGFDDNRNKARIGIYVVLLEALDASGGNVQALKGVVVVATRL